MDELLNYNTKFKCSCAIGGGIYGFIKVPNHTEICNSNIATSYNKLMHESPGTLCQNIQLPNGVNGPCVFVHSLPWKNTSRHIKYKNKKVLTKKSSTSCTLNGILTPLKLSIQTKVKGED